MYLFVTALVNIKLPLAHLILCVNPGQHNWGSSKFRMVAALKTTKAILHHSLIYIYTGTYQRLIDLSNLVFVFLSKILDSKFMNKKN